MSHRFISIYAKKDPCRHVGMPVFLAVALRLAHSHSGPLQTLGTIPACQDEVETPTVVGRLRSYQHDGNQNGLSVYIEHGLVTSTERDLESRPLFYTHMFHYWTEMASTSVTACHWYMCLAALYKPL